MADGGYQISELGFRRKEGHQAGLEVGSRISWVATHCLPQAHAGKGGREFQPVGSDKHFYSLKDQHQAHDDDGERRQPLAGEAQPYGEQRCGKAGQEKGRHRAEAKGKHDDQSRQDFLGDRSLDDHGP